MRFIIVRNQLPIVSQNSYSDVLIVQYGKEIMLSVIEAEMMGQGIPNPYNFCIAGEFQMQGSFK